MSDFDISLNSDPEDVLQNPGATTVSDPPLTISGALADYANRAQPPGNSLGLLMDEQQMRDAGIAKDGRVMPASYPAERPPTPGDDRPSADGVADAVQGTDLGQTASHGLGYGVGRLAGATGEEPLMMGLKGITKAYTYPLTAAEGVAHGVSDVHKGAPAGEAILGNVLRTGVVMGATALGDALGGPFLGAPAANYLADKYLPNGAIIGHGMVKQWSDPNVQGAMLSGP